MTTLVLARRVISARLRACVAAAAFTMSFDARIAPVVESPRGTTADVESL